VGGTLQPRPPGSQMRRAFGFTGATIASRTRMATPITAWVAASPETIAAWLTALADGVDGRRPLARASINQALAAVTLAHRLCRSSGNCRCCSGTSPARRANCRTFISGCGGPQPLTQSDRLPVRLAA
jgi:hypothetical protein